MKIKAIFYLLTVLILVLLIKNNMAHEKLKDGVLIELRTTKDTEARWIKIQPCTDEIIRVIASINFPFSTRQSLMAEKTEWEEFGWTVKDENDKIIISTSKLAVKVDKNDGAVEFYDANGNILLNEYKGGRIISSTEIMDEKTYNIRQIFSSPQDEAFYGLGAHQNNIWNYKEHDVDLWQLNIVDVIPFLVSSKNYGILWDNNSRTKFGDVRDYQSIESLKLFDTDGKEGGFTAEYFTDDKFQNLFTVRKENRIQHKYTDVNDEFPEGFQQNVKAVRWSGEIECNEAGLHKFQLYSSFYTKLWVDDELLVDSWRQNWMPWTHNIKLNMETGKKYKIKIEWIHGGGYIGLDYLPPQKDKIENTISLFSEVADQIDYYFIKGNNIDEVISGYRTITGKAPMMPKWAMGLWQCRERYKTQDELLDVVKEFRKRRIPLDNIVQDWFYWREDDWGSHDFDLERFPDPGGMVKELHEKLNTNIMISVWPKFYVNTEHYKELDKNGWLYKRNVEVGQKDWVGPGYVSTFYDPYNIGARELYWKQINNKLFSKGFDAWWLDATEPDIQSNLSREEIILRIGPTALGSASRYLNSFSLMNSKAVYEGQRKSNPDKRVFILTRSAFAGQQRYSSSTWSGDIASRWYDLKAQIPAGLNFCISGIPYWTTDIGGFAVEPRFENPNESDLEEWRELNTRWFQFGTFNPLTRVHGQFPYREIFHVAPEDHPAYKSILEYNKLRYRLMPYVYSLAGMVTHNDYTIMRALVMDFGNDKNVLNIGDQFMFGPAILVNPITDYKVRSRKLYLPEGSGWYELKTGNYFKGGQIIEAEAPYTDIPVYIKAGAIIPCGPEIQYTTEKPADPIRLFVYTGSDGNFTLYEDENINYNYEKGKFSTIEFDYNEDEKTLTISDRQGEFEGMLNSRTFEIKWISKNNPSAMDFDSKADKVVKYEGKKISVKMN